MHIHDHRFWVVESDGGHLPMMTGEGPFGPIEMGGMFTLIKVRDGIATYTDPGWYQHPEGTVAWKTEEMPQGRAEEWLG